MDGSAAAKAEIRRMLEVSVAADAMRDAISELSVVPRDMRHAQRIIDEAVGLLTEGLMTVETAHASFRLSFSNGHLRANRG